MRTVLVRYRTTPEHAAANEEAIHAVFDALRTNPPAEFKYASYRTDDATFVHIATVGGGKNPLLELPAFAAFQRGLEGNLLEPPTTIEIHAVDSFGGGVP
jgi:hypothetical protein